MSDETNRPETNRSAINARVADGADLVDLSCVGMSSGESRAPHSVAPHSRVPHPVTPESLPSDLMLLTRVDPVDGEHVSETWNDSPTAATLLSATLREPVVASSKGRRTARWTSGVAAAVVAAVVIGIAPWGSSPAYAIRQLPDGVIVIDWNPDLRNGDEIAKDLRSFGIDVDVVAAPATPSLVGHVVSTALPGQDAGPVDGITWGDDGANDVFTWRIDPNVFTGPLRIELGVEARRGESYAVAGEVFEPGEVLGGLHCALGEPLRADQLVPYLTKLKLTAQWDVIAAIPGRTDAFQEDRVDEVPDGQILWGYAVDSGTVRFSVRPDGVYLSGIDGLEPRLSDVPCTPEQAQGW